MFINFYQLLISLYIQEYICINSIYCAKLIKNGYIYNQENHQPVRLIPGEIFSVLKNKATGNSEGITGCNVDVCRLAVISRLLSYSSSGSSSAVSVNGSSLNCESSVVVGVNCLLCYNLLSSDD